MALQLKKPQIRRFPDVPPCFCEADWRQAAPLHPASNLISPLLLKPKLLSILVIERTRWLSNLWRMPSLIMIKLSEAEVSAVGRKWLHSSGGRCFFFACRQMQTAATGRGGKRSEPHLPVQMGIAADFKEFHSRMDSFTEINSNLCASVSSEAVVRLNNVVLIGFGQQWSYAAQEWGCGWPSSSVTTGIYSCICSFNGICWQIFKNIEPSQPWIELFSPQCSSVRTQLILLPGCEYKETSIK